MAMSAPNARTLEGVRVLSLALNLPGPAAVWRLKAMGATCTKLEPPSGDPMAHYCASAYRQMHKGIKVLTEDLKAPKGQERLNALLAATDILITSFRPSALKKLGLSWQNLQRQHPHLSHVAIVGAPGTAAEIAGHDLTYMAATGLVTAEALPPSLFADMAGALAATEAALAVTLRRIQTGCGVRQVVTLAESAAFLSHPRTWGLTQPTGIVGGAHAGYRIYACKDGRVAVAALEPHFATGLLVATGLATAVSAKQVDWFSDDTRARLTRYFAEQTSEALRALAHQNDLPIHCMTA